MISRRAARPGCLASAYIIRWRGQGSSDPTSQIATPVGVVARTPTIASSGEVFPARLKAELSILRRRPAYTRPAETSDIAANQYLWSAVSWIPYA